MLRGRRTECEALDARLQRIAAGQSSVLVLRGEAGIGKSALLAYLAERASGCRIARAGGVQSEMELVFAGLHQLCLPMLDQLPGLPTPQRAALRVAFGMQEGPTPDRFVVALAALSLLSGAAETQPLVCLIDDAQWLDRASGQALAFVARRLLAERVAMVFAVREPSDAPQLDGLPQLLVSGLPDRDARLLLASGIPGRLDDRVRDRIVAETRGNPLALLELPGGMSPAELAGGFGLPHAPSLTSRIERTFTERAAALPAESKLLLLTAAAEPLGDVTLLWRAARRLGIGSDAAEPAQQAGLVEFGARVQFRHPLVRSAIYRTASPRDRQRAHEALAEATDAQTSPDARVWHRAHATTGLDEAVAAELARSASRAQARGGLSAAAAFHTRAVELTPDPWRRSERALVAAQAEFQAGVPDQALELLTIAQAGPEDELASARAQLLQAQIAAVSRRGNDAPPLLLAAARRLEPLDPRLARDTYLDALSAAMFAGHLARRAEVVEVSRAAQRRQRSADSADSADLLLDALATRFTDGYPAAAPDAKRALQAFRDADGTTAAELRWFWLATAIAADLWDDQSWDLLAGRYLTRAREMGALSQLPLALNTRVVVELFAGQLRAAAVLVDEASMVTETVGSEGAPYGALWLAALRGAGPEGDQLSRATGTAAAVRGEGTGLTVMQSVNAMRANALGQYERAAGQAQLAVQGEPQLAAPNWGLVELVEAAARLGDSEVATEAVRRLCERTNASGTEWALGVAARSQALVSAGDVAESLYREAIDRLGRTPMRIDLARARLLYGEWLRRENRRLDARQQLGAAHELFDSFGTTAFAERARRELSATGETARRRTVDALQLLTPQEAQIAQLAAQGLSNPEIGAQLFISPRTVEYHLRKVFPKLDVSSRKELRHALPRAPGQSTKAAD